MSGSSRPTLHWLLWLVIALLPLRGWAWAWAAMLPAELAASPAVHTMRGASAELPPCHRVGLPPSAAHAMTTSAASRHGTGNPACVSDASGTDHPGCTLCSLCHAAAAPNALLALTLPDPLPEAAPSRTCAAPTPWSTDAPERPPKA
jgi:hypothetical protein